MRHYVVTVGRARRFDDARQRWTPGGVLRRRVEPSFHQALENVRLEFEPLMSPGAVGTMARVLMEGETYQFQDPGIEADWVEIEPCSCAAPDRRHPTGK